MALWSTASTICSDTGTISGQTGSTSSRSTTPKPAIWCCCGKKVISRTIIPDHFVYAIDSVGIGPLEPPVEFAYEHFAHWAHSSRIILHAQAGQPWQFFTGASEPNVITDGQIARIGADPRADHRHWVPNYQITGATYAIVIVIMGERVLRRELHLGPGVNEDHLSTIRWGLIDTTHLLLAPQP
jgi:hypothetical protein